MLGDVTDKHPTSRPRFPPNSETTKPPPIGASNVPPWLTPNPQGSKILTSKEIDEKRAKGLCFGFDEKYAPSHKCKRQHLFMMEIEEDDLTAITEVEPTLYITVEEQPLISLHAMTDSLGGSTIRVEGKVGNRLLHILIDSGSTHNFLDLHTAKKHSCVCLPLQQLQVTVANENNVPCKYVCKGFTWLLQGQHYSTDVFLLPMGS